MTSADQIFFPRKIRNFIFGWLNQFENAQRFLLSKTKTRKWLIFVGKHYEFTLFQACVRKNTHCVPINTFKCITFKFSNVIFSIHTNFHFRKTFFTHTHRDVNGCLLSICHLANLREK